MRMKTVLLGSAVIASVCLITKINRKQRANRLDKSNDILVVLEAALVENRRAEINCNNTVNEDRITFRVYNKKLTDANLFLKPLLFKRSDRLNLNESFKIAFEEKLIFEEAVFDKLLSKKMDSVTIRKFISVLILLADEKVFFKSKPITLSPSMKILEVQFLKDWRIYVIKAKEGYIVCNVGHKNTQSKDIKYMKTYYKRVAS